MKNYDYKHIAFHILIALYFMWLLIYCSLLFFALTSTFNNENHEVMAMFLLWIFVNLLMGTALFIVIGAFRKRSLLSRIVLYSYGLIAIMSIVTIIIIEKN